MVALKASDRKVTTVRGELIPTVFEAVHQSRKAGSVDRPRLEEQTGDYSLWDRR